MNASVAAARLWWRPFKNGGYDVLKMEQRGRRLGSGRMLTERQERAICKIISDKNPEQLKMPFALGASPVVVRLILNRPGIRISGCTMRLYLQRWGSQASHRKRP